MRFASPEYLYLLIVPIVIILLYAFSLWYAKRRIKRYGSPKLFWTLVDNYSSARIHFKFSLLVIALILLIFTLARPQFGLIKEVNKKSGIEAVISIDVSNSMLATGIKPNRLERIKTIVNNLVDRMRDDKIGLNVFAGEAYPQMPITSDIVSVKLFLDNISTGMVTLQGTSIASAINLATHCFTSEEKVGKVILIITDSEDHEEGAIEAAEEAKKAGMKVYVLGVGTTEGSTIPTSYGPLTDNKGAIVRTCLNERAAQEIAQAGGGKYFLIDNTNAGLKQLQTELSQLQQAESEMTYSVYNEQFVAVGILVLLLLVIEFILLDTILPIYKRFHFFE
jgi:Ca-activated chloride channel family protein